MTIVTQFITEGNTDDGDLIDIRRFYVQNGQVIPNSNISIAGVKGDSVTDKVCADMKAGSLEAMLGTHSGFGYITCLPSCNSNDTKRQTAFNDIDDFNRKGGLKAMGDALNRGMVLVMSIWDDSEAWKHSKPLRVWANE